MNSPGALRYATRPGAPIQHEPGQHRPGQTRVRQFEIAVALHQASLAATTLLAAQTDARAPSADDFCCHSEGPSRIFRGTMDQVAAVRQFVRSEIGDHPARSDAVLAASELAANAIAHTASGADGGLFIVHLAAVSAGTIAVLVTEQGGQAEPQARQAGPDAETGRGLDIVTSIASLFAIFGDSTMRTVAAVVAGNPLDNH